MIDFEQTVLVSGSPPCAISSLQQHPADRKETGRLLHVSVCTYRKQQDAGRYFLHGHPSGCSSWDDVEIRKLQSEPGVFALISPLCWYDARLPGSDKDVWIYKPIKWLIHFRYWRRH